MAVRPAEPSDAEAIAAMVREHAEHEGAAQRCHFDVGTARALLSAGSITRALIACAHGREPAGLAIWYPTFSSWAATPGAFLEDLYVRPQFRRLGLGRELLTALRQMTEGRIEWDVNDRNEAAQAFYAGLGAEAVRGWTRYRWEPHAEDRRRA